MSEKREFPILNGKLLSDLDLNGHKLLGLTPPGGGGGGSSVEVVEPSPNGAGKAADAKAVYEKLKEKQDALNDGQIAAVNSGVTKEDWDRVNDMCNLIPYKMPVFQCRIAIPNEEAMYISPFYENELDLEYAPGGEPISRVVVAGVDFIFDPFGQEVPCLRDCSLIVDCRGRATAPTVIWTPQFHPRTDAETDFKCEAGKRNVYWVTEYAQNEFCVAGWQESVGGGTSGGAA